MDLSVSYYESQFLSMRTSFSNGERIISKPILLIAILQMIELGKISDNRIHYNSDLETVYVSNYSLYSDKVGSMKYPFSHLTSDGFYHIKGNLTSKSPTPNQLKTQIEYAYFDDALWQLLQNPESRDYLRQSIIKHYLQK